ncbi:MAG: hypothetical protein LBL80_05055 [Ruminococcus sp.]|jgi:hypothetical protein|nr:hypothetical protein [Ruminococcus sp.]
MVGQLLQIKRIPMDIEINVTPWKFERIEGASPAPRKNTIESSPLPIINDFNAQDHLDINAVSPTAYTYQPVHPQTKAYGQSEDFQEIEGDPVSQISKNPIRAKMAARPIESVASKITPRQTSSKNVINWSNGNQSYSFDKDDDGEYAAVPTSTEWKFVPRSVEIIINQLPDLEIKYLGSPLYFPRSADPNYVPPEG